MTRLQRTFRLMTCLVGAAALLAVVPWADAPAAMPDFGPSAARLSAPDGIPLDAWPGMTTPFDNLIPAPPPAAPPARKPLEGPLRLNFKDASLHSVLEYLSASAGLVIVETVPVESRVTVMSLQPLTVDETVGLLNTILKEKGFAAVRTGRTLKIVALTDAKKAAIPVTYGGLPERIEQSDQVVTHIIPVQFADAAQLKTNLATLLPDVCRPPGQHGDQRPDPDRDADRCPPHR